MPDPQQDQTSMILTRVMETQMAEMRRRDAEADAWLQTRMELLGHSSEAKEAEKRRWEKEEQALIDRREELY